MLLATVLGSLFSTESSAETAPPRVWCADNLVPPYSSISIMKQAATGLGAFPYLDAAPGVPLAVRIGAVPLRNRSPFGVDLESIPAGIVDSLVVEPSGDIRIMIPDPIKAAPVTTVDFGQGIKRRMPFAISFIRGIGDSSGVMFNGASSGIHASDTTLKAMARSYFLNYARLLRSGGRLSMTAWGERDRDALVDLDRQRLMGERKTDAMTFAAAVDNISIGSRSEAETTLYYRAMNSRFSRYGDRKSLDDNGFGLAASVATSRGKSRYTLKISDDVSIFDSRLHDRSWTRHDLAALGVFSRRDDRSDISLEAGFRDNSEYGGGVTLAAEVSTRLRQNMRLFARMSSGVTIPDIGGEYYASMTYSDSVAIADLDKAMMHRGEIGFSYKRGALTVNAATFVSQGERFLFRPSSTVMFDTPQTTFSTTVLMSDTETLAGVRGGVDATFDVWGVTHIGVEACSRDIGSGSVSLWPYPASEMTAKLDIRKKLYGERINSLVYGNARVLDWRSALSSPRGTYYLCDAGLTIGIGTLALFYHIDNITGETIPWFRTFGWLERNGMWGASWQFFN